VSRWSHFREALEYARLDVARWVDPQQFADPDEITFGLAARLAFRHVPLRATLWLRLGGASLRAGIPGVGGYVQRRLLLKYGLEISPWQHIEGGFYVAHPSGCVLFANSIGKNVTVISRVTFGLREERGGPTIGSGAYIGVGACVLGSITVGDGATVGANAVVLHDVPAGVTVVGIPAAPIRP
jgi:serine O-acetyltransferase